ncbi:protein RALF-like 32 [Cocos nucifera]|nr:protein RALF-like 32 [Cocos nucifera]
MERKQGPVWLLSAVLLVGGILFSIIHGAEIIRPCNGSIAECQAAKEFLLDSETHRRFLQQMQHIDYGALNPDRPACNSGNGKPYEGNCVPPRSGNPPSRGCNPYDHCRS